MQSVVGAYPAFNRTANLHIIQAEQARERVRGAVLGADGADVALPLTTQKHSLRGTVGAGLPIMSTRRA